MADKMVRSIVEVLQENGVEKRADRDRHLRPVRGGRVRARRPEHGQRLAGDVGRARRQDARRARVPEDLVARSATRRSGRSSTSGSSRASARATITAKVNEYLYEHGFDFVYDIIVASGGNTSPYRRWHTDKVIREGDLVIVDQNAVGPGGYFVDFVRCFKVGGRWTPKEKDLYKECYESMYAAIEMMKAGNTTADVAAKLPKYADDEFGTVTLQQFAHSIGLSLYEGMWISRAYSLDYPVELEENMYFAAETFAGHPGLEQTVRLEENLLVTKDGPVRLHQAPVRRGALSPRLRGAGRRHRPRLRRTSRSSAPVLAPLGAELVLAPGDGRGHARRRSRRDADALLVCYAPIDRARGRGGGRRRLQGDLALRDRLSTTSTSRPRPSRHPSSPTCPDYCLDEVADHTLALLLGCGPRALAGHRRGARAAAGTMPHGHVHRLAGRAPGARRRRPDRHAASPSGRSPFGLEVVGYDPFLSRATVPGVERVDDARGGARRGRLRLAARAAHRRDPPPDRRRADRADAARARRSSTPSRGGLVDLDAVARGARRRPARRASRSTSPSPEPLPRGPPAADAPARDRHAAHGVLLRRGRAGAAATRRDGRTRALRRAAGAPVNPARSRVN